MKLNVEYNSNVVKDDGMLGSLLITPSINEDYWTIRVPLSENQAIVAFPKFTTFGIGFQKEEDWNSNLPFQSDAEEIFNHIRHNKGNDLIDDADCIEAIRMLQQVLLSRTKRDANGVLYFE